MKKEYIIAIIIGVILLCFVWASKPKKKNIQAQEPELCDDGSPIPEGQCDCNGNVPDACGECGGTVINAEDCGSIGDVLDDNGVIMGQDGTYEWGNRVYNTKIYIDAEGNSLEWMVENFANLTEENFFTDNQFDNVSFGDSPQCRVYGVSIGSMENAMTKEAYITYGGLYNHAYFDPTIEGASNRYPMVDGWRLPTEQEWLTMGNNEYGVYGLCSVDNWEGGLEGDNQTHFNLQPCGWYLGYNGANQFSNIGLKACYLAETHNRYMEISGGNSNAINMYTATARCGGVRLVRYAQ